MKRSERDCRECLNRLLKERDGRAKSAFPAASAHFRPVRQQFLDRNAPVWDENSCVTRLTIYRSDGMIPDVVD